MDADTELLDYNFEETCIADTPVTCEEGGAEEAEAGRTLQLDTEEECANELVEWGKQMGVDMSSYYNDNSSHSGGSGDTVVLSDAKDEDTEVCDSTLLQELHPETERLNASNKEKMTEIPCRYVLEHGRHSSVEGNVITKASLAWNNHSCTTSTGLNEINNDNITKDEGNQGPLTLASSKNVSPLKRNIDDGLWPLNIDHRDDDEIENYPSEGLSRKTRRLIFATPELMPLQSSLESTNLSKPVISSLEPELLMKQGKGFHVPTGNDMDYLNSQEPGEESQALALGMVDKLVWMNSIGLSQDPNLELESDINLIPLEKSNNPGMKSIVQVAEANGSANGLTVFDWVDSQQAVEFHASKENNHPSKATQGPQVQKSQKVRHAFVQRRTKESPPGVKARKNNSKQKNKTGADLIGKEEKMRGIMKWQEVPEGSDLLGKNTHQLLHDHEQDKHAIADNSAQQVVSSPTNAETMLDYFENQDYSSRRKKLSPAEVHGGGQGEEENVPEVAIAEEVEIGMGTQIAIEAIEIMRHGSCVHIASYAPIPSPPSSAQAAKINNLIWGNRTRSGTTRSRRESPIANDFGKKIKQVSEQSEAKQEAKDCQVEEDINRGKPLRHSNKNATFHIQPSANIDEPEKEEKKNSCTEQILRRKSGNKSASKTMIRERSKSFVATTEALGNNGTFLMTDSTRRSARISALKPANCASKEITRSTKSRNLADCGLEARHESGKTVDKCATAQSTEKCAALLFPVVPRRTRGTVPIKQMNRLTGGIKKDGPQEPSLSPETPKQKVITPKELPLRVSRSGQRRQHLDIVNLSNTSVPLATETPLTSSGRKRRKTEMMYVLFSHGLSSDIVKHQKKILMKLGGNVANNVSDCTHFVADKFVRTGNMLEAMASGKPVVTVLWLESCGMAGCYINDKSYILRDLKKEKELGFSIPTTIFAAQQRPLLQGMKVYVTRNAKPEAISSIVKAAGGEVTTRYSATCPCLVISCEEDRKLCAALLEKGVKVYSTELIFNGIIVYRLDLSKYILFSEHTIGRKAEHKKR